MSRSLPAEQRKSIEEATAEAEARPLDYDPSARAQYIRSMLTDITSWQEKGEDEETIRNRSSGFIERYPELFKKIIQKQDLSPIYGMLSMLDRMGDGRISQHQASIVIGKKLVDQFVTPQLSSSKNQK